MIKGGSSFLGGFFLGGWSSNGGVLSLLVSIFSSRLIGWSFASQICGLGEGPGWGPALL